MWSSYQEEELNSLTNIHVDFRRDEKFFHHHFYGFFVQRKTLLVCWKDFKWCCTTKVECQCNVKYNGNDNAMLSTIEMAIQW